jgi:hypothetical protein
LVFSAELHVDIRVVTADDAVIVVPVNHPRKDV